MPGQAIVTIGARYWTVALATTPEELTQGLGGVASIPPGTGMLFDLGSDQIITVITVPMLFPLDIVFIHSAQGVVGVARGVPPSFLVTSDGPARFFLEVNAGEAEGVQAGASVLIEPQEAVAVEDGGVASIVNFGVSMGVLALVMGMLGTVVRAALPRPERPALYDPREELLPQTEAPSGDLIRVRRPGDSRFVPGQIVAKGEFEKEVSQVRDQGGEIPLGKPAGKRARPSVVHFIGWCRVMEREFCIIHGEPVSRDRRCPGSNLTDDEWRMTWEVAEQAFPEGQQPPASGLALLPQVEGSLEEGWRPKSMQEVDATVARYAHAMRRGLERYQAKIASMVDRYRGSVEKAIDSYRRYLIGEYRRGEQRPALAPAVIGPRERREPPEGLEYFADSAEQLLASTNPYRAQTDAAFREAIERVRAGQ